MPRDTIWTGYRRRIRIAPARDRVDVEMEDDCHHFGVLLVHDGITVTRVETREPRHPWTTCPLAGAFLRDRMAGVALADAARVENQRQHCTHLYDLFVLGAHHALDVHPTIYDIRVGDSKGAGRLAELDCDGIPLLRWRIGGGGLENGVPGGDYRALEEWSRTLEPALQEPAQMLRRGVLVSGGRALDFPTGESAGALLPAMRGTCFTFQPDRAATALRVAGTLRDFSRNPEQMLSGDQDDGRAEGLSNR